MEEAKAIITCDEIIAERDRLTVAAINKLNQIALTGSAMLVEGHQGPRHQGRIGWPTSARIARTVSAKPRRSVLITRS